MVNILLFIKKHFRFAWFVIEWGNGLLFRVLFKPHREKILRSVLSEIPSSEIAFRKLEDSDMCDLHRLIYSQDKSDLEYFKPHGFGIRSLRIQNRKPAFLMMGAFFQDRMVGYFFLRFFADRKCFVGRLVDNDYRGKGIGKFMNYIMYELAWRMQFQCLSTISRHNSAVMLAHSKNSAMIVRKELQNDYLLVEFKRNDGWNIFGNDTSRGDQMNLIHPQKDQIL